MPFTATWMALEIIIASEVSQKKTNIISAYMQNFKKKSDTNKFTYKIKTDSQI